MNKILQKEQCESSVDSFNAKIRDFKNLLRFYIYSSFDFEFILIITFLAINSMFLKMLKQILQESFFFYFCIIDTG